MSNPTGHLSPNRDHNADMSNIMERGRKGLTGRKGYNDPAAPPSPSPSNRSASASARSPSMGSHGRHASNSSGLASRRVYNADSTAECGGHLSPDLSGSRPSSRGQPATTERERSRSASRSSHSRHHSGMTGRKGYNADGLEGRKGYNADGLEGRKGYNADGLDGRKGYNDNGQPSPDSLEPSRRSAHSRSASAASGSDKHSPSPVRAKFSPDPLVDYSPRTHVGMGGRKGYNTHHNGLQQPSPLGDGRVCPPDGEEATGLGIRDGFTGRKGYNSSSRTASPASPPARR